MAQGRAAAPRGLRRWLPGVETARRYDVAWLAKDLIAGIALTSLLVPAGMAYAQASGLPPINGLYASIVPLLVYAVVGPSRILVLGPDSSLAPLVAATVLPLAATGSSQAATFAAMLAILTGALCVLAGLARFGFLTDLLSVPIRYGYLTGIALVVFVGQLPNLFGFSTDADGVLDEIRAFVDDLMGGETDPWALGIGLASLAVILGLRRWLPAVPGVLVAVVGAMIVVAWFDPSIPVVGRLPRGLPSFAWPGVDLADVASMTAGAVGIAFVAFADTSVLSRTLAARRGETVDANQELVALGVANVSAGLFQGFPISSSSSRTPVAESAGARTQLTNVVGALAIALLLVLVPGLTELLPSSALAAVVIAAAISIAEVRGIARLASLRRSDFWLAVIAFAGVAVLGSVQGIFLAIGLALLNFVRLAWRPHTAELARVTGLKGYHDTERHPEGRRVPGLILYRFDAPLFFANASVFESEVLDLVARARSPVRRVVVTAEPITDVDVTAADMLRELHEDLAAAGVVLAFAGLKGVVRDRLADYGLVEMIGPGRFHRTVGEAVRRYVAEEGVDWVDWEEAGDEPSPPGDGR